MNKASLISIIIPVYGVEKYIEKCLISIKAQTFKNFEVLIINDGTKDQSIKIARKTIENDKRFIIIHQENQGQGSARNLGLDLAKGDYISFIDADDYVEPDFLEIMYEKILETSSEICTCNVNYVDTQYKTIKIFKNNIEKYKSQNDYLISKYYISNFMCDKLFLKSIFLNFRFDQSLKTNEDVHLLFEIIYNKKITSTERSLYNYLQRPSSTSKGAPESYISDRLKIIQKQLNFHELHKENDDKKYITYVYLKKFVFITAFTLASYSKNYNEDIEKLKTNINKNIFTYKNIFISFLKTEKKTLIALILFKISPNIFQKIVKTFLKIK